MISNIDYALMAGHAYQSTRGEANYIPVPDQWIEPPGSRKLLSSGFEAGYFVRGDQIVISFAGTGPELLNPDWLANFGLTLGVGATQLNDAAAYYMEVKNNNPGAVISFTGHSLGGGLAALLGVLFDETAVTFDPGPFRASANNDVRNAVLSYLTGLGYSEKSPAINALKSFHSNLPANGAGASEEPGIRGESNVSIVRVTGEAIDDSILLSPWNPIGVEMPPLTHGGTGVSAIDLHSQALLTTFVQNDGFREATIKLTDLLPMVFDKNLFARDTDKTDANLLEHLLRHQVGVDGSIVADGMLDRFTSDLQKIASDAGLSVSGSDLTKALIAFALQMYYEKNVAGKELFVKEDGGIHLDSADVANSLGGMKGYQLYFQSYLSSLPSDVQQYAGQMLAGLQDWYIAGGNGMSATAWDGAAFMLGAGGMDNLTGSSKNDLLVGLDNNDRLVGGKGDDVLIGGNGLDVYYYRSGDGNDAIIDSDRQGQLIVSSADDTQRYDVGLLVKQEGGGEVWTSFDNKITLTHNSPWAVNVDGGGTIQLGEAFQDGDFGIHLYEETTAPAQFDRKIVGDLEVESRQDDIGNYIPTGTASPDRDDGFFDSTGNDLIQGLGGKDFIYSWRGGDDRIEGGAGDDWMVGGPGKDIVIGGAGRDILVEGVDDDKLYADEVVTLEDAIAAGEGAGSGQQGEALSGGTGDDLAIGGTGNDALLGGRGDDIIVGGAGNDDIDGDAIAFNIMRDWSTQRIATPMASGTSYSIVYNQFNMDWPTQGGDDVIYAGAGEDWVLGGYGNDVIDGGSDADKLWGEGGNDDLFGGAGNDVINGDNARLSPAEHGNDTLDGEDGDDTLFGEGGSDLLFGGIGNDKLYADGSGAGYDYLDGEAGVDELLGGALDDELFGGEGDDFLQGDSGTGSNDGDDYMDGEAGDDMLLGEGGQDEMHGGDGADQIAGDNGGTDTAGDADAIFGGAGNDIIDGQGGDDVIDGGADNDLVAGGLGNDLVLGGDGDDQLQGGEGDDVLEGGSGTDILFGENGNDTLRGGDGTDHLLGGMGDDMLDGGAGDDVYYYNLGEGNDRISDSGGADWLVFADINLGQITLGTGSLKLNLPDGSELHLDDFDPDNPYAAGGIEYFQFADGSVLTKNQLINALGIQPTGTPEADILTGTALSETIRALAGDDIVTARAGDDVVYAEDGADVVYGGDGNDIVNGGNSDDVLLGENGNDTLYGDAGNDLLSGGAGTDTLLGGDGDDLYLFQSGDGQDTANDALGNNAVVLGSGLTLEAVVFTRQGSDLLVTVKNSMDRLTVKDWFAANSHFTSITLGDGITLDHAGVEAAMPRNQAPVATQDTATVVEDATTYVTGNALYNDSDPEGRTLRVTNAGTYAGAVGMLSLGSNGAYSYTLANGGQSVQSLAAGQSLTETFAYTVTDDDPNGAATASSSIRITVQGTNDLPTLGTDSAATTEDAAPIGGNVLANDGDIDAGTVLAVTNPGTRSGTYGSLTLGSDGAWNYSLANVSTTVQSLAAGQTVAESFGFNVSDGVAQVGGSLLVRITGQNDAPILVMPLADQSASTNSSWSWQVPIGSFSDVDAGDVLGYTATLADGTALPTWLAFDAATQTFSGRVPKSAAGSIDIRVAATDRASALASDVFTLSFASGTGGGGGGGGSQGNEGVGNGVDGPPPGHDASFNDGAGTAPGNPGAQGGNGYVPPRRSDLLMQDIRIEGRRMAEAAAGNERGKSAPAHAAAPGQVKQAGDAISLTDATGMATGGNVKTGNGNDMATTDVAPTHEAAVPKWLQAAAWAYLDSRGTDVGYAFSENGGDTVTAFMRWLAVQQAIADQGRNGLPDWLDTSKGADPRGMLLTDGRFVGSDRASGNDSLGLLASASFKTFDGLGNGIQQIA